MSQLTVAIICGGPSSEHEVSCVSGGGVLKGIDTKLFRPLLIGITKAGKWVALENDYPLAIVNKKMPTIEDNGTSVELTQGGLVIDGKFVQVDCVFPVLHGEFGEDGKIQQLLENVGLAYVGSGVVQHYRAPQLLTVVEQFLVEECDVAGRHDSTSAGDSQFAHIGIDH